MIDHAKYIFPTRHAYLLRYSMEWPFFINPFLKKKPDVMKKKGTPVLVMTVLNHSLIAPDSGRNECKYTIRNAQNSFVTSKP